MPIYPLNQSPVTPASERLTLVSRQSVSASPYSGATAVVNNYAAWGLELNFPRMNLRDARLHTAWLDELNGSVGTFRYRPAFSIFPVTYALSLAAVAYPMSTIASIAGFPAGGATGLVAGQYIAIGDQLLRLASASITADDSGHATVEFNPPLRSQFAGGTGVETENPFGVFRMVLGEGEGAGFQIDYDRLAEFGTLRAGEAL